MSAVWVKALELLPDMARAMGDRATAAQAEGLHARALTTLRDKLWLPDQQRYAFALLEGGKLSSEITVWPATALAFGLVAEDRGQATASSLAGPGISTDWGARALAPASPLFDPLHYNNGTVWPFATGFDALGLYRYHAADAGFAATYAVARTAFLWGLGSNPEVFSGSAFEPLDTAVPQQFFATSMLLTPLLRGTLGWEADAPHDAVTLAPHLPAAWDTLRVERLPAGSGRYTVRLAQSDTLFQATLERTSGRGVDTLRFSPALPLGAHVTAVTLDGNPLRCATRDTGADVHVDCVVALGAHADIVVRHTPGYQVMLPTPAPQRGARSSALKLLSQRLDGADLVLRVAGRAGWTYHVAVRTPRGPVAVDVVMPPGGDPMDDYTERAVRVTAAK